MRPVRQQAVLQRVARGLRCQRGPTGKIPQVGLRIFTFRRRNRRDRWRVRHEDDAILNLYIMHRLPHPKSQGHVTGRNVEFPAVPRTHHTQHTVRSALDGSFGKRAAIVGAGAADCGDFSSVMKQGDIPPSERHRLLCSFLKFGNGDGLRIVHDVVVFRRRITPSHKSPRNCSKRAR